MRHIRAFILLIILLVGGYILLTSSSETPSLITENENFIEEQIQGMSLDQKIGQLLIVGFENPHLDNHIREMITRRYIGGVNLLARNVQDKTQITNLIRNLKILNISRSPIPLLIAADQEGGSIVRFNFMKELTPQSKITNATSAERVAYIRGGELKEIGVNMNFAPLADYVTSTKAYLWPRVFHGTPSQITEWTEAMLQGYSRAGVIPVLKHFPGYGNVTPDPHATSTLLNLSDTALEIHLSPFRELIRTGDVPALMTAHIIIPRVDSRPATFSSRFMEILRNEWKFEGVIITDDLEMGSTGFSEGDAALEALKAGGDMLILTKTPAKQIAAFERLKTAVIEGDISEARLNMSLRRILKLKANL
ncbi:MAG: glycoside hydrolase family 3 protein [Candidatus Liptonbacteria bacterium]|nr:glycoside hydrolase family 3 protein [Candidatus Liptonbacteria bacterium]